MTAPALRPYQLEVLPRIGDAWREGRRAPLLVTPTGSGKTVIVAEIIPTPLGKVADHRVGETVVRSVSTPKFDGWRRLRSDRARRHSWAPRPSRCVLRALRELRAGLALGDAS